MRVRKGKNGWDFVSQAAISRFDSNGDRKTTQQVLMELGGHIDLKGPCVIGHGDLSTMVWFEHNDPMPPERLEKVLRLELTQHAHLNGDDLAAEAVPVPIGGDELIHRCALAQPDQVRSEMCRSWVKKA